MREVLFLVVLALLVITGEARPKDELGVPPVSPHPALAASNGTKIETPKTPRRFVAEGYGKRSVPDEGEAEEDPESEVEVGPPGGDIVVKERKEGNQDENEEGEEKARDEERDNEREATASTEKTKITFSRDRRSPQNKDSAGEVDNDRSSEEDTRDNTTVVIAIARPQRPGSLRTSEGGAAGNEKKPEIAGKETTEFTTDTEETTSSKFKRSPQSKDDTCEDDKDGRSEDDTSDDSTSAVPIVRQARPGTHKVPAEGATRKEETSGTEGATRKEETSGTEGATRKEETSGTEGATRKEETSVTEGKEKSEGESTDDTTVSEEDRSSSRSKRHPQSRDGTDEVDDYKSSEEDKHELTPAVASSPIASAPRPLLRRPTEVIVEEARVPAGNVRQEGKEDQDSAEDTTGSSEETNTKVTSSRNKRSPQKNDGTDKSSKDAKDETTVAPTITRAPRPPPRRNTVVGGVTGTTVTHERPTPTPAASKTTTHTPASKTTTLTPASKTTTHTPIIRRPTPTHTTNGPSH